MAIGTGAIRNIGAVAKQLAIDGAAVVNFCNEAVRVEAAATAAVIMAAGGRAGDPGRHCARGAG